jgi:glutathione S-transferase
MKKSLTPEFGGGNPVTHYAEGSLMPILIGKIMCKRVPERAPLLLKPLLWGVFDAVSSRMIAPRLDTNREYVRASRTAGLTAGV